MRHPLKIVWAACALAVAAPVIADDLAARIRVETQSIGRELIETRRYFHQHPELSNREVETGPDIARRLRALGLTVREPVAGTGVVGELEGALPGAVRGLAGRHRRPADRGAGRRALPLRRQGVMHACGHDVHITVGLGAAEVLSGCATASPAACASSSSPPRRGHRPASREARR